MLSGNTTLLYCNDCCGIVFSLPSKHIKFIIFIKSLNTLLCPNPVVFFLLNPSRVFSILHRGPHAHFPPFRLFQTPGGSGGPPASCRASGTPASPSASALPDIHPHLTAKPQFCPSASFWPLRTFELISWDRNHTPGMPYPPQLNRLWVWFL